METNIIRLLNTLITNQKSYEEKIEIFEKEYGIKTSNDIGSEVKGMYAFSRMVLEEGIEQGQDKTFVELIKNLMTNLHINMNEAMDLLNTPVDKREIYAKSISQSINGII